MAVPYHTHLFDIPVASKEEVIAGVATDKVVTPSSLGSAALRKVEDFATAEQGRRASTAVQRPDLADVAISGSYHDLKDQPALGSASAKDASAFATAAQGNKADTAVQLVEMQKSLDTKLNKAGGKIEGDLEVKGNINFEGNALTISNHIYASWDLNVTGKINGWGAGKTLEIDTITGDISGSAWGNGKLSDYLKRNTVQPKDLGALARKDKIAVADIDAKSAPSGKLFLSGDGSWKEPPGGGGISGGKIDGDLNVSGEMNVRAIISDNAVTGFVIEVFDWEENTNGRQRHVTGGLERGGDLFGEVWGKKDEYGKLSDYLKARLPKTFAVVDKDNKVVSIADGLENIEVSGMRVVGIAEERDFDAQMPPIGYDTALAEETGASVDVSGNVEIQPPLNPYLPDLSNWRLHAAIDLEKGLRDRFNAAITRMPAPKRAVSRAKLARKPVFQRHDPLFEELIADPKFGMTKDQFDTFWKNALILN